MWWIVGFLITTVMLAMPAHSGERLYTYRNLSDKKDQFVLHVGLSGVGFQIGHVIRSSPVCAGEDNFICIKKGPFSLMVFAIPRRLEIGKPWTFEGREYSVLNGGEFIPFGGFSDVLAIDAQPGEGVVKDVYFYSLESGLIGNFVEASKRNRDGSHGSWYVVDGGLGLFSDERVEIVARQSGNARKPD